MIPEDVKDWQAPRPGAGLTAELAVGVSLVLAVFAVNAIDRWAERQPIAKPMRPVLVEPATYIATPEECERILQAVAAHRQVPMTINTTKDGVPWYRRTCLVAEARP